MITKTIHTKANDPEPKWYLFDAKDYVLGKLAVEVAKILKGKNKPQYQPDVDHGDFVIIINADKVQVTGKKLEQKVYYHHTGYPGQLRSKNLAEMMKKRPLYPIQHAIKGMLPKNRLGHRLINKVKIYTGDTHPHKAQKPIPVEK